MDRIVQDLNAEIQRLTQARDLLLGKKSRPGRPAGSTGARKTGRRLSPEGRRRISEAMRKRWAERRKQGAKNLKAA